MNKPSITFQRTSSKEVAKPQSKSFVSQKQDKDFSMLASDLLAASRVYRYWHLETKSLAEHKNLQMMYETLEDGFDSIAELSMGLGMTFNKVQSSIEEPESLEDALNYAKYIHDHVASHVEGSAPAIKQYLEALCGSIAKFMYLYTLK